MSQVVLLGRVKVLMQKRAEMLWGDALLLQLCLQQIQAPRLGSAWLKSSPGERHLGCWWVRSST